MFNIGDTVQYVDECTDGSLEIQNDLGTVLEITDYGYKVQFPVRLPNDVEIDEYKEEQLILANIKNLLKNDLTKLES